MRKQLMLYHDCHRSEREGSEVHAQRIATNSPYRNQRMSMKALFFTKTAAQTTPSVLIAFTINLFLHNSVSSLISATLERKYNLQNLYLIWAFPFRSHESYLNIHCEGEIGLCVYLIQTEVYHFYTC